MTEKNKFFKKLISVMLTFAILLTYLPFVGVTASASELPTYSKIVDDSTMDTWENYFGPKQMHTTNAGGVWTDKSVFTDESEFPASVQNNLKLDNEENSFLVALSAIAANKEIVGYSTIPTDTVLVLDVSGSMAESNSQDELVLAANLAIDKLLKENNNNRVGVVLYSGNSEFGASNYTPQGTVTLLPINRYTATNTENVTVEGKNVTVYKYIDLDRNTVKVDSGISPAIANAKTKDVVGGTYIQAGLWEAYQLFNNADTTIGQDNFQSGQSRMPILVLMSDGAPTSATTDYANVGTANVGNGSSTYCATNSTAFLTQLTASYVFNRIKAKYKSEAQTEGKGLFYTLGFGDDFADAGTSVAESVLNPSNSTNGIESYWNTYFAMTNTARMQLSVPRTTNTNGNPGSRNVFISKNAYVTTKDYVTEFHSASNTSEMLNAFDDIVDEILIQSRYYPTHLEGNTADFGGYVTFEDKIGEFMEVKDIKGILIGEHLFTGEMMASKLNDHSDDGLGTIENPTELGHEFIGAIKARLGIVETAKAQQLATKAFEHGQLGYNAQTHEYSNYIGWYAYADGTFAGFYHEGKTNPADFETADKKVVYANKSYGFLGEPTGSLKDSDMMYMSVQVHTNIQTGQQTLILKIPAALVPMITYLVTLKGTTVQGATDVNLSIEDETVSPIRLIFEVGLDSDINELNVAEKVTGESFVDNSGARRFYSNYFYNPQNIPHEQHETTIAAFTPSLENERFYYTTDTPVLVKNGDRYDKITDANYNIDVNGEYYHALYVFKEGVDTAVPVYERISKETLEIITAIKNNKPVGWDADYDNGANASKGAWIVPINTVYHELSEFRIHKTENPDGTFGKTKTIHFATYRYVTATNASYEIDQKHGNNGLLTLVPAQGIKLSKTVDNTVPGTEDNTFKFRITLKNADGSAFNGTVKTLLTTIDSTEGTSSETSINGSYTVDIKANQSFYMTQLPSGTTYTIEEITQDSVYKVKTVHINGLVVAGTVAAGTVQNQKIDDVDFLNTQKTHGNLIISKELYDENGNAVNSDIEFTAEVALTNSTAAVDGSYETQTAAGAGSINVVNGKFRVTLKAGQSISVNKLPEGTNYTVTEITPPQGFAQNTQACTGLTGTISQETTAAAKIVNTYKPTAVNLNAEIEVIKTLSGRSWKSGEKYEFKVEMISPEQKTLTTLYIDDTTADKKKTFDLSAERFNAAGTYQFKITETIGDVGGMTFDSAVRRFDVKVEDAGLNGTLDIVSVTNVRSTTVSQNAGKYTVSANFTNVYAPTTVTELTIPVVKQMANSNFALNGFKFGLFEELTDTEAVDESTLTNVAGNASFKLDFAVSEIDDTNNAASKTDKTYTYFIKEINTAIPGMTYATNAYKVVISFTDNLDGTVTPSYVLYDAQTNADATDAVFKNHYDPTDAVVVFSGKKEIDGNRVQNAEEFEFNLYETDSTYNIEGKTAIYTTKNTFDGSFLFDYVTLAEAKDYYFVVTETKGNIGGIIYDKAVYQIKVSVTNDNGTLKAAAPVYTVDKDPADSTPAEPATEIIFTNEYDPTDAVVQFTSTKILEGKNLKDNEFEFVLKNEDGTDKETVANIGNTITFSEITYTEAGIYKYTVNEKIPTSLGSYDYDYGIYEITVNVTDDSEGTLTPHISISKSDIPATQMVFRNGYISKPVDLTTELKLEGKKTLEGRPLNEGEFEFKLENVHAGTTLATVKNDANGNFKFENITVKATGEYHYRISEIGSTLGGVTYDSTVYDILFKVEKDMESGELEAGDITVNGVATIGNYDFKNTYKAAPTDIVIKGTKTLGGRELENGEFTFKLYRAKIEDNKYVPDGDALSEKTNSLVENTTDKGEFTFDAVEIPVADTYHFVVVEDSSVNTKGGVTYDANVFHIKVVATDMLDGTLQLATTYDVEGAEKEGVAFTNTYKAKGTQLLLQGVKTITNRDLVDNEFTFNLYETDATFSIDGKTAIDTTTNAGDGKFAFTSIDITEVGEGKRYFVVTEDSSAQKEGVTYDDAIFKVTVTITDDKNGQLKIEKDIVSTKNAEQKDILFANLFTPAPVEFDVNVKKKLVNETSEQMGLDGFKFALKGDKNTDLTATTDAEGNAKFALKFTAEDIGKTYTYKVTEIDTEIEGMVYSTEEYTIKVTISVDNNGNLLVNLEDNSTPINALNVEFTNTYKGVPEEEEPPKEEPPKEEPPKEEPPKEEPPKEEPPKEEPPKEEPPKEEPPKEEPPKEEPPKEEPPKEEPPKDEAPETGENLPIWSLCAVLVFGAVVIATARKKEKEIE